MLRSDDSCCLVFQANWHTWSCLIVHSWLPVCVSPTLHSWCTFPGLHMHTAPVYQDLPNNLPTKPFSCSMHRLERTLKSAHKLISHTEWENFKWYYKQQEWATAILFKIQQRIERGSYMYLISIVRLARHALKLIFGLIMLKLHYFNLLYTLM